MVIFSILLALICGYFYTQPTSADDTATSWPWTGTPPRVFESTGVTDVPSTIVCSSALQSVELAGLDTLTGPRDVCVSEGNGFRHGMYFDGHRYHSVVGFGLDLKMYPLLRTPCGDPENCVYLPSSDTLAVKQPVSSLISILVIYKNFSKHLYKSIEGPEPFTKYAFDESEPDFVFQNDEGYRWPVGGIGGSNNGKWLAIEIRERGIAVLDLEQMQFRRISGMSFQYNFGSMPITEMAISNDGFHVAVAGMNAGLTIFDSYPGCGDELTNFKLQERIPVQQPCPAASIDFPEIIERFKHAIHPNFNDDGGELRFYALSYTAEPRLTLMRAASYTSPRMDYIALGDSFSSGEGETDDLYYLKGTNNPHEKCHVSTRSYPYLIAQSMAIDPEYMRSVACSGARTDDVIGSDNRYWGQGKRLDVGGLNLIISAKTVAQTSASELFIPGRIHQVRFVSRYQPKAITIGIGGNDAGFVDKLRACAGNNTCDWASSTTGRERVALEVRSLFNKLVTTYSQIHHDSPNSKIYAIGYPKIIDPDGSCDPVTNVLFDRVERKFMDEGIIYINQVVEAAARKSGIAYVDISDSFGTSQLCGATSPSAVNGLRLGDDTGPIKDSDILKVLGAESFHPTPKGHKLEALAIQSAVNNILTYSYCQNRDIVCPTPTSAPQPSAYWLEDGIEHGYRTQRSTSLVRESYGSDTSDDALVSLPTSSLEPGSNVRIEIHSTPTVLASSVANPDGSAALAIRLPAGLEDGFHTLHLYGTSFSGEMVDLYQTIIRKTESVNTPQTTNTAVSAPGSEDQPESTRTNNGSQTASVEASVQPRDTSEREVLGAETHQNSSSSIKMELIYVLISVAAVLLIIFLVLRKVFLTV